MNIKKRNGDIVKFDSFKIKSAMEKAFNQCKVKFDPTLTQKVVLKIKENEISVEEIQDLVVKTLMENKYFDVAIEYTKYREIQTYKRSESDRKVINSMSDVLYNGDFENSNKNSTLPSVTRDIIAGVYFRNKINSFLSKEIIEAHEKKTIHWHDSDVDEELTNCCLINIEDMLRNGTRINNADIETPNSVGTAMNIAMQIVASVSSQQFGGVSVPNFNEVMAEYAKKNFIRNFMEFYRFENGNGIDTYEELEYFVSTIDSENKELATNHEKVFNKAKEKTAKEIYDACQLYEYQTNSILGSASQTPRLN